MMNSIFMSRPHTVMAHKADPQEVNYLNEISWRYIRLRLRRQGIYRTSPLEPSPNIVARPEVLVGQLRLCGSRLIIFSLIYWNPGGSGHGYNGQAQYVVIS